MSAEAAAATEVPPVTDTVMAPPPDEETSGAAPEAEKEEDKPAEDSAEDGAEAKDSKSKGGKEKETKAPSRRSTRISSKPQAASEAKETTRSKRSASTRKRAADDGEDGAKTTKKAKSDSGSEAGPALGSLLPDITLKSEKDTDVQISLLAKEKGVVLFLVPKADTPGCNTQACGFRDIYDEFTSVDYDIYCVSADPSAAQSKWQEKKTLPYGLLSDPERKLISALGANDKGKTKRSHFVFAKAEEGSDGKGKLIDKRLGVKPADSPKLALDFIKEYVPGSEATNGEAAEAEADAEATANGNAEEKPSEEVPPPVANGNEDVPMQAEATAEA